MIVMPTYSVETIRPLSNDERRAEWASRYFCAGNHHEQGFVVETHSSPFIPGDTHVAYE